jgi:hypothetical protein
MDFNQAIQRLMECQVINYKPTKKRGKIHYVINRFIDLRIYIDLGLRLRSIYIYRSINPCIDLN